MIFSKITITIVTIIIAVSIIFANLAHQLDVDVIPKQSDEKTELADTFEDSVQITDTYEHLMWFLQISDIHISIFHDHSRVTELKDFCTRTIDAIKPKVVLASGDLTDAKHKNNMGSAQHEEEWIVYNDVLKKCDIKNKTIWFDIRGNHDNFNVPNWNSSQNYFKQYSMQGSHNQRSYMKVIQQGKDKFAFIAVDACLEPGPRRPFNFMGMLSSIEIKRIQNFVKKANELKVNHIIWFGHYPSSCVFSLDDHSLRDVIGSAKSSKVYLCGHLHQLGGLVTEMYTIQRQGYLELELGDWKDNRMFRLLAIDHGLFSFIDNAHGNWPLTLITNPKHNMFLMPSRESLSGSRNSTHIRLITFSISPIDTVHVKINEGQWIVCKHIKGPLYAHPWNPSEYFSGIHIIYAKVRDVQGRESVVQQPFSFDGSKTNFKILPKTILMLNATTIFQSMFGTMILISILPLLILRHVHHKILLGKSPKVNLKRNFFYKWLRKLWLVSNIDSIFYPLIIYEVYLIIGPWFVGEVLEGHIGAIFSWGIIVNGEFIPGLFTYVYGFIQLFLCQIPLTLVLANCADERFCEHHMNKISRSSLCFKMLKQIPFILIITVQMVLAYFFWLAYGYMALFIGPLRSWSIILNIYLWHKAMTLSPESTREMTLVWISPNLNIAQSSHDNYYQKS
ncbi:transmembrane protein 62-like [Arctopsyche grandis]|uniref:transmembrane protein 62-like n=1 Tax=Arctopsyche grandis TaxID=121162 RepID=UPI00406D9FF3